MQKWQAKFLEHCRTRRKSLEEQIAFLDRPIISAWEDRGSGRIDVKPQMLARMRAEIEHLDRLIAEAVQA